MGTREPHACAEAFGHGGELRKAVFITESIVRVVLELGWQLKEEGCLHGFISIETLRVRAE